MVVLKGSEKVVVLVVELEYVSAGNLAFLLVYCKVALGAGKKVA